MKFQNGQSVIVIDTTHKPAGSAIITGYNPFTRYYKIILTYYDSGRQEEIEVPEQRLLKDTDVVRSFKK